MGCSLDGMPPADYWSHGVRSRYNSGCRCDECRAANTAYERKRVRQRMKHGPDGLVDAKRARRHLLRLSKKDVGRRAVSAACDVGNTTLEKIKSGAKTRIRRSTEQKILEVDVEAASDSARIDAGPTWKLLNALLERGWAKAEIARRLGYKVPALQISKKSVLVKNAHKVKVLHAKLIKLPPQSRKKCRCPKPLELERDGVEFCVRCEKQIP